MDLAYSHISSPVQYNQPLYYRIDVPRKYSCNASREAQQLLGLYLRSLTSRKGTQHQTNRDFENEVRQCQACTASLRFWVRPSLQVSVALAFQQSFSVADSLPISANCRC